MARLIDADALIEMCENPFVDFIDMDDVRNAPTIDAVPVVRCKDCIYNPKRSWVYCPMTGSNTRKDDDFCSYGKGERRC